MNQYNNNHVELRLFYLLTKYQNVHKDFRLVKAAHVLIQGKVKEKCSPFYRYMSLHIYHSALRSTFD